MLTIYHASNTRGLRVIWTAEEIGLPYGVNTIAFDQAVLKGKDYLDVNPFGSLPAIDDGDVRMSESGAICQYLTERYGKAPFRRTAGDGDYPRYLQWLHAGEATLVPHLGVIISDLRRPRDQQARHVREQSAGVVQFHLRVLDEALAGRRFILGDDITLPDVMIGYALHLAALLRQLSAPPANVASYWERLQARPGYQIAIAA